MDKSLINSHKDSMYWMELWLMNPRHIPRLFLFQDCMGMRLHAHRFLTLFHFLGSLGGGVALKKLRQLCLVFINDLTNVLPPNGIQGCSQLP